MKKYIISLIAAATVFAYTIPVTSFAKDNNQFNNLKSDYNIGKDFSGDFDLLQEIETMASVHEMKKEEKAIFDQLVEEEVAKFGGNNPELYRQILNDFFDHSSGHANDIVYATQRLEADSVDFITHPKHGEQEIGTMAFWDWVPDIKIGVNLAGSLINVAIGVAVGGGVGAIQGFIIAKGKKEAQRMFTKTVVSKLTAWGAPKLALFAGAAVAVAMDYSDIGTKIAKYIDSKDNRPKNGWIDIYN